MINARAETLSSREAFRNAYARHRCLLPVNGFYEWRTTPSGKQPMHIGMASGEPFGLGGLYERWLSPQGDVLDTCAIVTTAASSPLRAVHDRMPVIVAQSDYDRWLDPSNPEVDDLLAGWTKSLRVYPVSTRVNAVRNDDPDLCVPIDAASASPLPAAGERVEAPREASEADDEPVQAQLF